MNNSLLNSILSFEMNYETFENSFSPIYSSFGLGLDGGFAGIRTLYLHYNRYTRVLWEPLLTLPGEVISYTPRADKVSIKTAAAQCEVAFYAKDCVCVSCKTSEPVVLFSGQPQGTEELWVCREGENSLILQGYSPNGDDRDPDKEVAIMAGLRVICGKLMRKGNKISVSPIDGKMFFALNFDAVNVDAEKTFSNLLTAPNSVQAAADATQKWIGETVRSLNVELDGSRTSLVFVKAIITLIFNLAKAQGNLENYISSFPNRGGYPTHFTWDSCFQNLAYELMNADIARDSLLQLCANIRADGKIPQFLCSTWGRPHDAQPALLGWAAKRYYENSGDIEFVKKIFEPLEKNNRWWLTQRITRFGLIKCADGLETGQDNSPRFDEGTVLAVDMNSYLLSQLRITADFARLLGLEKNARHWENEAQKINDGIIKHLYDENKNLFFDAYAATGEKQSLITTSGLIPLWAGVTVPHEKAQAMVKDWLLNPKYFYADVPFPSVAYNQSVYDSADWWRGPTWMPEAWLMLEILKRYGFENEHRESATKLYNILLDDGQLHELFNSKTGEGMGRVEQGWTAAIFIKLHLMFM